MLAIGLSAFLTLIFIVILKTLAPRLGLVDKPGGRKIHIQTTPVIGGLAIFLATAISLLIYDIKDSEAINILAVSFMLVAIGALDDVMDLSAKKRLFAHLCAGAMMIFFCGERITGLEYLLPFESELVAYAAVPVTILAVAAAINAINMTDGVDGLAGSIVLGVLLLMGTVAHYIDDHTSTVICFSFATALTVFLSFNFRFPWRHHADIFLGDAGSTFLGFTLVWLAIRISNNGGFSPIVVLWIFAVPVTDTLSVVIQRRKEGRHIFSGGRDHLHHMLLARGFMPSTVAVQIALIATSLGAIGVLLDKLGVNQPVLFICAVFAMGIQLLLSARLRKKIQLQARDTMILSKVAA